MESKWIYLFIYFITLLDKNTIFRAGTGLKDLFNCSEVQQYLFGIAAKELAAEKDIYQPGCAKGIMFELYSSDIIPSGPQCHYLYCEGH